MGRIKFLIFICLYSSIYYFITINFSPFICPSSSTSLSMFDCVDHNKLWKILFSFNFILFLNLKHCISFAKHQNESTAGIHVLPILNPPPLTLPTPSLWVVPVHQPQASSIMHWTWTGNSFHTWYFTCFNVILPNLSTLSLSHRDRKAVLYISVSFAVSYTGLLLASF